MSKKCYIYETMNPVSEMQQTKTNEGLMTLSGVFGVCGKRNNNHRIYETKNYGKMVMEMQERIKRDGAIPGELEHPNSMNINLENISHKITDIRIDENGVVSGSIQLLNTPKGKIAQAIVEGGLPLYVSTRATGEIDKNGIVTLEHIATADLVGSPGFSEARMHLNESQVYESLGDNCCIISEEKDANANNIKDDNMHNMNEDLEKRFQALEDRISDLENENQELRESLGQKENIDINIKQLCEGIQNWIVNEYSPVVESWVSNEYGTKLKDDILEGVKDKLPEVSTKQLCEGIQNWITGEYSSELQKWITEEYSPAIQNWITEEYSPIIQNWMNEEFRPEIQNDINESLKSGKENKLTEISNILSLLESIETPKPVYGRNKMINESKNDAPIYVKNMPDALRPKYEAASANVKESIDRRARLYDFSRPGSIEKFWENVNFEETKPTKTVYENVNTGDLWEQNIRAQFRRFRH